MKSILSPIFNWPSAGEPLTISVTTAGVGGVYALKPIFSIGLKFRV